VAEAARFRAQLHALGSLVIREVRGDGNCMFRAVADQVTGSEGAHAAMRTACCDFMLAHPDDFAPFLLEEEGHGSLDAYVAAMRRNAEWGGNLELQALSRSLGVNVAVHQVDQPRWELTNFHAAGARTISLAYHDGDHYNSVRGMGDDTDAPAATINYAALLPPDVATILAGAAAASAARGVAAASAAAAVAAAAAGDARWGPEARVLASLPRARRPSAGTVRAMLADMGGDVDATIEAFLSITAADEEADTRATPAAAAAAVAAVVPPALPPPAPAATASDALPLWRCDVCGYEETPVGIDACDQCTATRPPPPVAAPAAAAAAAAATVVPVVAPPPRATAAAAAGGGSGGGGGGGGVFDVRGELPRRNGPCRCGSGEVYRKCCMSIDLAARSKIAAMSARGDGPQSSGDEGGRGRRKPRTKVKDDDKEAAAAAAALAATMGSLRI